MGYGWDDGDCDSVVVAPLVPTSVDVGIVTWLLFWFVETNRRTEVVGREKGCVRRVG